MQRESQTVFVAIALTLMVRLLYMTFGVAMDAMFASFTALAASITVSAGWHTAINNVLALWTGATGFFAMETAMYILIWGWVAMTLVMDMGYNKPQGMN
jgi:hypothetical protein